eukprot:scaffold1415_cov242-Pinguiococcus_pyrenoidosus.AAC.3
MTGRQVRELLDRVNVEAAQQGNSIAAGDHRAVVSVLRERLALADPIPAPTTQLRCQEGNKCIVVLDHRAACRDARHDTRSILSRRGFQRLLPDARHRMRHWEKALERRGQKRRQHGDMKGTLVRW